MAISDVLSDAIEDIRTYLNNQPDMYASIRPRLDRLIANMEAIRIELDRPPTNDPTGPEASAADVLYQAT